MLCVVVDSVAYRGRRRGKSGRTVCLLRVCCGGVRGGGSSAVDVYVKDFGGLVGFFARERPWRVEREKRVIVDRARFSGEAVLILRVSIGSIETDEEKVLGWSET